MKNLLVILIVSILSSASYALECQNLSGNYFFSDLPMRSMHIAQNGCQLTIIHQNEDSIGAPLTYTGDGMWSPGAEDNGFRELHSSTATASSYLIETKLQYKQTGEWTDQRDTLQKRADGDIIMKTTIVDGKITESGSHLLIRENSEL